MSISYPDGRRPQIPSIIASFADGHPSSNPDTMMGTNNESFVGGGATFSFETHLTTPVFQQKPESPSNTMQTDSHLMVGGNHGVSHSGDYDMDIANDDSHGHRDEDFDIDLDIGDGKYDDGDIDLDLATPMGMMEDDFQMGGATAPIVEEIDDEMADDAAAEAHNEEDIVLNDDQVFHGEADRQIPIEQHQFGDQGSSATAISEQTSTTNPFQNLAQSVEDAKPSPVIQPFSFLPPQIPKEHSTTEVSQIKERSPTPTILAAGPSEATAPIVQEEGVSAGSVRSPKQSTPPPSNDTVRTSQAETVSLENPTPEVNQREWTLGGVNAAPARVLLHEEAAASPEKQNEIPTSPLQASEHSSHNSPTPGPVTEQDPSVYASAEQEQSALSEETDDDMLSHPIVMIYRDTEFSLFPPNGSAAFHLPETSFLSDRSQISKPFCDIVSTLRDVLGNEFSDNEELVLTFGAMGLQFEEDNSQMRHFTMLDMVDLYSQLSLQDGASQVEPLYISLSSRPRYITKLEMIRQHLGNGGGLQAWKSGNTDMYRSIGLTSHQVTEDAREIVEEHQDIAHQQEAPLVQHNSPEHEETEVYENDDELELEEFEKEFEREYEATIGQTSHSEQPTPAQPQEEANLISRVDVPKSPSQDNHTTNLQNSELQRQDTTTQDGSTTVPETQYPAHSEHSLYADYQTHDLDNDGLQGDFEDGEHGQEYDYTEEVSSIYGDHPEEAVEYHNDSAVTGDNEASFVTAQEKGQSMSKSRTLSHSGSYGIADTPVSEEEDGQDENAQQEAGDIDFDELERAAGILPPGQQQNDADDNDTGSSATLEQVPEGDHDDHINLQSTEAPDDVENAEQRQWNEWTYVEDDEAEDNEQDNEAHNHPTENTDDASAIPDFGENAHYDLPEFEVTGTGGFEGDDEFAYYPQQFSDLVNPEDELVTYEEDEDDHPHYQGHVTPTSGKRARDDEDDEEEEDLEETGERADTLSQASKRHRTT